MKKTFKNTTKILIVLVLISLSTYYFDDDLFTFIFKEDGIVEYTGAFTLLVISILLAVRFIKRRKNENNWWITFNIILIVFSFFGFGEEISWGQRIFSIESGEFFSNYNAQNETNLHNLKINGVKINKILFSYGISIVFGLYFIVSLFLYKKYTFFRNIFDTVGVQIPKIKHSVILIISTFLIMIIPDGKKWEAWEGLFVLILLLVFLEPYNKKEKLIN